MFKSRRWVGPVFAYEALRLALAAKRNSSRPLQRSAAKRFTVVRVSHLHAVAPPRERPWWRPNRTTRFTVQ